MKTHNKTILGIYSIVMGSSMLMSWVMIFLSEEELTLIDSWYSMVDHLTSEMGTAVLLIIGGIGILKSTNWADKVEFLALGMCLNAIVGMLFFYITNFNLVFVIMGASFLFIGAPISIRYRKTWKHTALFLLGIILYGVINAFYEEFIYSILGLIALVIIIWKIWEWE